MKNNTFKILFNKFRNMFIKENPYYINCLYCGKKLKRKQRKFCSSKCTSYYHKHGNKNNIKPILIDYKGGLKNAKRN